MKSSPNPNIRVPNKGKIVMAALAANAMLTGWALAARLRELTALVKTSPKPHHPTGIRKAQRAAKKRRNVLRMK